MNSERKLLPTLISLPTMKRMVAIGANQGHLLASLSHMMRTTIMGVETKIHLQEAWEMMLWVEHSTKFLDHLSHAELREGNFLAIHSTHVHHLQWSYKSTRARKSLQPENDYTLQEWDFNVQGISIQLGALCRWGGLIVWVLVLLTPSRSSHECLGLVSLLVVRFLSPWTLYCSCPCEKVRPWKRTQIGTGRCLMRLMGILMMWL